MERNEVICACFGRQTAIIVEKSLSLRSGLYAQREAFAAEAALSEAL